ncbi:MAG: SGNH/GDSL hydrolase family protein [Acidimicrobiia bacterium]|nr:SGNH/GDSL hydrolase family protein [Acidimicrobiia bacterium]
MMRGRAVRLLAATLVVIGSACSRGSNATVPPTRRGPNLTYVAIGNGETAGNSVKNRIRSAWPQIVYRTVFPRSAIFVNLGQNSVTIDEAAASQLPVALSLAPDVVTVELTDDTFLTRDATGYQAKLERFVQRLQRGGRTRVILGNIPPGDREPGVLACTPNPPAGSGPCRIGSGFDIDASNARDAEFNQAIAAAAAASAVPLVDLHAAFLRARAAGNEDAFYAGNDFSPNEAGHAFIARQFEPAVRAALKSRP